MRAADFPPDCALIEVRVSDLNQLFNSFDPTPFQGRDLDPQAEEFIVGWAREVRSKVPLGLLRDHFQRRAHATRQKLHQLFRLGRRSLLIGVAFLATCIALGDAIGTFAPASRLAGIVRESLLIGGWVAMWRPIEIFLYEWWPIRAEAVLSDRLSAMRVRVTASASDRGNV